MLGEMYGKIFERMYTGSMMGAGAMMFAVWPYVIAHMKPAKGREVFTVELNSQLMAILIGEKQEDIDEVIRKCCEPDPRSRTPENDGRKLVKLGTYEYEVVNGAMYNQIRREEELRENNRKRQAKHYHKKKGSVDEPELNGSGDSSMNGFSDVFKAKWAEWLEHLRQKKKPPTKLAQERQLKRLMEMGEARAIAAIEHSIANSWQGIFEKGGRPDRPAGHVSAC